MRLTKTLLTLLLSTTVAFGGEMPVIKENRTATSQQKQIKNIRDLSTDYQLVMFVSSRCHWCHQFAPTVKAISDEYGIAVQLISFDGQTIKPFKKAIEAKKENFRFFFKDQPPFAPVLFLQHKKTNAFRLILEGAGSKDSVLQPLTHYAKQGGL